MWDFQVVAGAPEERTFFTRTRTVLVGSRDEALETERLADDVEVVVAMPVRDAIERSPSDGRVLARHRAAPWHQLLAQGRLTGVLGGPHDVASGFNRMGASI